jgi:hypothetical protein
VVVALLEVASNKLSESKPPRADLMGVRTPVRSGAGHHFRGVQDIPLDRIGSDAHFVGVTPKSHSRIDIEMLR